MGTSTPLVVASALLTGALALARPAVADGRDALDPAPDARATLERAVPASDLATSPAMARIARPGDLLACADGFGGGRRVDPCQIGRASWREGGEDEGGGG